MNDIEVTTRLSSEAEQKDVNLKLKLKRVPVAGDFIEREGAVFKVEAVMHYAGSDRVSLDIGFGFPEIKDIKGSAAGFAYRRRN
ncbi:hypothetical protein [Shewanella algae]|uniref:hypothetical protein n=1 Tax=Shewanella algae TaxID=38313 RepID=UPI00313F01F2